MAALTAQTVDRDGLTITFSNAAAGGDTAKANANALLVVKNDDAASKTVTLTTTKTVEGLAVADLAVSVAAGAVSAIRLGPVDLFADSNGDVAIAYSATTNVKVAVVLV